jgi:hypothetical protein
MTWDLVWWLTSVISASQGEFGRINVPRQREQKVSNKLGWECVPVIPATLET